MTEPAAPGIRRPIYIAGPEVFLPNCPDVVAAKSKICGDHGFAAVFPAQPDLTPGPDAPSTGRQVSRENERRIELCDALIANMTPFNGPSMDVGTAYEMGFMRSLGRPVLGYTNVPGSLRGAVFDDGTEIVEHAAPDNVLFDDLRGFVQCVEKAGDAIARSEELSGKYYNAKPWTWTRAVHALKRLDSIGRLVPIIGQHVEGLYILRVPLITLLLLGALPFLAFWRPRPLLENLFVDFGFGAIFVTTLISFLTAASAVAVINGILVNGHERFPGLSMGKYYGGPFHWLAFLAPAPLVWTVVQRTQVNAVRAWFAVLAAVVVGLVVLFWIRIEQGDRSKRLRNTFDSWTSRPLVYPLPLPFEPVEVRPRGEPVVLRRVTRYGLLALYVMACGVFKLRHFLTGPFRMVRSSGLGQLIEDAGRRIKSAVPEAGFVYVSTPCARERPFYSATHYLLLFSIVLFLAWLTLGISWLCFEILVLPALAYLVFTLWVGCLLFSGVTFLLDRHRIPLLTLLIVWALFGNTLLPNDHYYDTRQAAATDIVGLQPSSMLDARAPRPVILVAAAGGGIQAAAWTARVLTGLAEELPGTFARSVVLLSGVSGGATGIYHFADAYGDSSSPDQDRLGRAYAAASASSLEDVAAALVTIDLLRAILPIALLGSAGLVDRGWALERAFDRRSAVPGTTIAAWEQDVLAQRRPAVIFNATLVESGVPLLFATTRFPSRPGGRASYDALDFRALRVSRSSEPPRMADIPLATAVRLSASFPFVTPVATSNLAGPVELSQHVADGGYYDSFGMMSLMTWLNDGLEHAHRPPSHVLVLQIHAFPETDVYTREPPRSSFFQTYAPLKTLASVRGAAQRLRNEQEFEYLRRYWQGHKDRPVTIESLHVDFKPAPADAGREPPLSWRLNADEQAWIERIWMSSKKAAVEKVRKFLAAAQPS